MIMGRHSKRSQDTSQELMKALTETIVDPKLRSVLDHAVALVLNADYTPVSVLPLSTSHWKDTVRFVFQEKVDVIHTYEDIAIRSPSTTFQIPSIIVNKVYRRPKRKVQFTKANVFMRDRFTCQYCDERFAMNDLTYDHVLPRKHGGKTCWENIVASCEKCNGAKESNRNWVSPIGLVGPKNDPVKPTYKLLESRFREQKLIIPDREWMNYLAWKGPLWEKNPLTREVSQLQGPFEDINGEEVGF